ncbi:MAG: hypothetical protein E7347_07030 [Clostridiales bacterium]|nr:hypothetical protein [Clostridiales bacterium]
MKKIFIFLLSLLIVLSSSLCFACKKSLNNNPTTIVLTKEDYAEAFNEVVEANKNYLLNLSNVTGFSITESDFSLVDDELNVIVASVWLIGFLRNICNTESFVLTDGQVESKIFNEGVKDGYTPEINYLIRFDMDYDQEKNIIYSNIFCDQMSSAVYISYEINYDFEKSALNNFVLKLYFNNTVFYFIFKNNKLYKLNNNSDYYQTILSEVQGKFDMENAKTFGEELHDFTIQYYSANPNLF